MAKRKKLGEIKRDKAKVNERARFISNAAFEKRLAIEARVHRVHGSGKNYEANACVRLRRPGAVKHCGIGWGDTPTQATAGALTHLAQKIRRPSARRR